MKFYNLGHKTFETDFSFNLAILEIFKCVLCIIPGGDFHIRRSGGSAPNFASEILVGAPNFVSKNINDKYPKFYPLNFRYDPKIETLSQLLRLAVKELPKFFLLFDELGQPCPKFCLQT